MFYESTQYNRSNIHGGYINDVNDNMFVVCVCNKFKSTKTNKQII